jgi:hypothetical protein
MKNYDHVMKVGSGTFYYLGNELHRTNGPAIEYLEGMKGYYIYGKKSRLDGPAVIMSNGQEFYYYEGVKYSKEEFERLKKLIAFI